MTTLPVTPSPAERGTSLLELIVALTILAIGVLAVSQLFPAGTRSQVQDRLRTEAIQFAREKVEQLELTGWSGPDLTVGRHPAGAAVEPLGSLGRSYQVDLLAAPLDNLKRVTVKVAWNHVRRCSLQAVTYLRK
ncbi:MAG TPA: prepilin-type N-terminal cleavage/methylation domain-containing protein [Candidatus Eisenbacteria bacterium]|jgi:prepilin-type N-terminal cleavage/methylation domain-containing protein